MKKISLVIPAAGSGTRVGLGYNKLLYKVKSKTIIELTVEKFKGFEEISEIIIACNPQEKDIFLDLFNEERIKIIPGGKTRQESVKNALRVAEGEIIFVHDGARANISEDIISTLVNKFENNKVQAAVVAVKCVDTIHQGINGEIQQTLNRDTLWSMQTPQCAQASLLKKAYEQDIEATDETSLLLSIGVKPVIVEGSYDNFKVTTASDLERL